MKVVVDTNVFVSGVFFGGKPQKVLEAIVDGDVSGLCSVEILQEYREIVQRMIDKKGGTLNPGFLSPFYAKLQFVEVSTAVNVCRDRDDDKFLACALDGAAYCVVSGDSDLLSLREFTGVKIMTAAEFLALLGKRWE